MTWVRGPESRAAVDDLLGRANALLLSLMTEQGMTPSTLSRFMHGHPGHHSQMPAPDKVFNYTLETMAKIASAMGRRVEITLVPVTR